MRADGFISVGLLSIIVTLGLTQPGEARHREKSQTVNSDPCAAPHDYVKKRIEKIKALRAPAPKTNATLFDVLGGQRGFDTKTSAEIGELRYEADGVNALLAAGGCPAFDVERELSTDAK